MTSSVRARVATFCFAFVAIMWVGCSLDSSEETIPVPTEVVTLDAGDLEVAVARIDPSDATSDVMLIVFNAPGRWLLETPESTLVADGDRIWTDTDGAVATSALGFTDVLDEMVRGLATIVVNEGVDADASDGRQTVAVRIPSPPGSASDFPSAVGASFGLSGAESNAFYDADRTAIVDLSTKRLMQFQLGSPDGVQIRMTFTYEDVRQVTLPG